MGRGDVRGGWVACPEATPMDRTETFSTDWPSGPAPLDETGTFSTGFAGGSRAAAEKSQVDGLSFRDLGRGAPESVEKMAILSSGCPRDPRSVEKTAILSMGYSFAYELFTREDADPTVLEYAEFTAKFFQEATGGEAA